MGYEDLYLTIKSINKRVAVLMTSSIFAVTARIKAKLDQIMILLVVLVGYRTTEQPLVGVTVGSFGGKVGVKQVSLLWLKNWDSCGRETTLMTKNLTLRMTPCCSGGQHNTTRQEWRALGRWVCKPRRTSQLMPAGVYRRSQPLVLRDAKKKIYITPYNAARAKRTE